jgi:hypothetical protein
MVKSIDGGGGNDYDDSGINNAHGDHANEKDLVRRLLISSNKDLVKNIDNNAPNHEMVKSIDSSKDIEDKLVTHNDKTNPESVEESSAPRIL